MDDGFYEFQHECDAMPDGIRFIKINGFKNSQFSIEKHVDDVALHSTVVYGFKFCPYCGERVQR